jgi:adenylate kinase family enzyme
MDTVKRIAIIGNAGSGKSTLARRLGQMIHIPVYHLDKYFWGPNWTYPNISEYKIIHDELCERNEWIIDGMQLRLLDYRAQRADVIIFLDIPRYVCLYRIFKRTFQYYGKETPSSAEKCPERINWSFFKFLKWVWDFKSKYPTEIKYILDSYSSTKQIYIFRSQLEVDSFVKNLSSFSGL